MMMLVTTTHLQTYPLVLMVNDTETHLTEKKEPALVEVSWLSSNQRWTDSKSFAKLKQHHRLTDNDFAFIEKNSLSNNDCAQALLLKTIAQINDYAQKKRKYFDLPMDFSIGTQFQQQVWRALQGIDYGETISYAGLASRINHPKAFRAVANANGKNPFSVLIPCHRVIARDGKLGGYTGGLDKKAYLLALEVEGVGGHT